MINQSYYNNSIPAFLETHQDQTLGKLADSHHFSSLEDTQINAWKEQIRNLKEQLKNVRAGEIFFEFSIPRMGKRVDVVLLIEGIVFVIEYKTGARIYHRDGIDQVVDYALDLKNFHLGSHNKYIVPILVCTNATFISNRLYWYEDKVSKPLLSNGTNLSDLIFRALSDMPQENRIGNFEGYSWAESGYKPTPTIVEAAQALYQGHSVEEISRSDAGAENLTLTTDCIYHIIAHSKQHRRKSICFVTGVPGAGKTLAGLNISTRRTEDTEEHAVFLSGNGPLVKVLKEALARDEVALTKARGEKIYKNEALQKVAAFIQNIHHFRDEGLKSEAAPVENIVVFDEAQRAWNRSHAKKFMVQKRGATEFDISEPEFLISLMDRKQDWCTIICLIGGGQEINTGEAGLSEWFDALNKRFRHWDIYHSCEVSNRNYSWGQNLVSKLSGLNATKEEALHLAVSLRSYRAENLSKFVGAVIDGNAMNAKNVYPSLEKYHLVLTRDIKKAREWLREKSRGTERFGLLASSGGIRLKPEGIHIKSSIEPEVWFLNGRKDVRSSYYLEEVATEFDIQGLELDWTAVCWDADFRRVKDKWSLHAFKGTKWQNINDPYKRVYLANAYRVLLTRARQGMVIFVPKGDERDYTRPPSFYDETYEFLKYCGISEI
ncbi:MAG: hypothetical protein DHS20C13_14330 [Thermodesulfobacteriota bacterium]|nr:MAG: hypothetical protein DHS20C13_14330 [Thermodesulfobacteriota bacterium]